MYIGSEAPFISQKAVRCALNALLHATGAPGSLQALLLVDEILADPGFPRASHSREFAVNHILVSLICEKLGSQREKLGLLPPDPRRSRDDALREIQLDIQTGSFELVAWSLLYYRYVRPDLNLTADDLESLLHVDERTLRRYLEHATKRLTDQLVEAEWETRCRQRQRRLLAELRSSPSTPLIGRNHAFELVNRILQRQGSHHIYVTGAAGIGKSAFVSEVLRHRIEAEEIDALVWLESPGSAEFVRQVVRESFVPEGSAIDCREFMLMYRVAIVLDGVERLQDDGVALEDLLEYLSPAEVYVVSTIYLQIKDIAGHIALRELSRPQVEQLVVATAPPTEDEAAKTEVSYITSVVWDRVGGNPLAVKLAARSLSFGISDPGESVERLYAQMYERLSGDERRTLCLFALLPPEGADESHLSRLGLYAPASLIRRHALDRDSSGRLVLGTSARRYVQAGYATSPELRRVVDGVLLDLEARIAAQPNAVLNVLEHVLVSGWPGMDALHEDRWIRSLWRVGVRQGHHAQWRVILERRLSQGNHVDSEIDLAYGICLRRLCEWPVARRAFAKAIQRAGQAGQFPEQARAILELAVMFRYQGDYGRTASLLRRAEKIASRTVDEALRQSIHEELAQVYVDQGDVEQARRHLTHSQNQSGRRLALCAEVELLAGNVKACLALAERALQFYEDNRSAAARVHTLVARSYQLTGDLERAHERFATALAMLEVGGDALGIARTQSNLAALLIDEGAYPEAYQLLRTAEKTQSGLGDRAALLVTRHNLRLLRTRMV